MKEFACNKVAGSQASILLKIRASPDVLFQEIFGNNYFNKHIFMPASAIFISSNYCFCVHWFKTAGITFHVLCVLVNHCIFYMMRLTGNKSRLLTLFYETNWDCSSSIDSNEKQCTMHNRSREVAYASRENFFIGLRT